MLSTAQIQELSNFIRENSEKLEQELRSRYSALKVAAEEMPYCKLHDIKCIDLRQGFAHLEMLAAKQFSNVSNVVCGGAIATLVDISIGAALATLINFEKELLATVHLDMDFLRPAAIGKILCVKASWSEIPSDITSFKAPCINVPENGKKLVQATATVVEKSDSGDKITVAKGSAWYVIKA